MKIRAAVTNKAGDMFEIQEVDLAEPKQGEMLVKIAASGVCHTDAEGVEGHLPTKLPAVLGHEGAGTVVKVGPGVKEFKEGDRVGISFAFCNHCHNCYTGKPYSCIDMNTINFGGIMPEGTSRLSRDNETLSMFFGQSSFAEYAIVDANCAVKIPYDDIDLGIVAPMCCGIQTGAGTVLNSSKPEFGSSIVIFGCGTVGFSAIMVAKIAGCSTIIAVGGKPHTLALAKELGATHTINRKECEDITAEIRKITKGGATTLLIQVDIQAL